MALERGQLEDSPAGEYCEASMGIIVVRIRKYLAVPT
jgi:hypothetical protein